MSIANQEAIERLIRKVNTARDTLRCQENQQPSRPRTSPSEHYHIAATTRLGHDLTEWLGTQGDDPAIENFIPRLKDHLLARLRGLAYNGDEYDFSDEDRDCILLRDNKIFEHSLLRVNYTTYDLRREQDTINPLTRADIMLLSQEDERTHPYWYARVVRIFHVMVEHRHDRRSPYSQPTRMDVLFVRWFQRDSNLSSGWDAKRLHRLQFFNQDHIADAFGFVDPDSVIRGVHLIPAFAFGPTDEYLGPSFVRQDPESHGWHLDWRYFYINM
ncbi:hypothetical protein HYDPIDRAFT_141904 [Hydnomerulius pinastri MD-312]|uniref:Uncharacterized protein n=1 Tax=Hydnomerulius pinastri MD-312 TaxID=994086 RepID=A0A0C9UY03_9AGAM|nr:hypothetical protein HYDPIDRAFT_141904 [Hydnomerulius pinastri MD-312]